MRALLGLGALGIALSASAQVEILATPERLQSPDLRAGDLLWRADGSALDLPALRGLEWAHATSGAVVLQRERDGVRQPVELPAGSWALEALPAALGDAAAGVRVARADGLSPALLAAADALALQLQMQGHSADAAELGLLGLRWSVSRGDWIDARRRWEQLSAPGSAIAGDVAITFAQLSDVWPDLEQRQQYAEAAMMASAARPEGSALALLARARAASAQRKIADAKAYAQRVRESSPDTLWAAEAAVVLALQSLREADRPAALAWLQRARQEARVLAPEGQAALAADALEATIAALAGDAAALDRMEAVLKQIRVRAPRSMLRGGSAINAHQIAMQRRELARAEDYAREALATFRAISPGSLALAQARTSLADVLWRRRQLVEAEALYAEALTESMRLAADSYESLSTKAQLAQVWQAQARLDQAQSAFDALLAQMDVLPAEHPVRATMLMADVRAMRANLAVQRGDAQGALIDAEAALALYAATTRGAVPAVEARLTLAQAHLLLRNWPQALDAAELALARYTEIAPGGIQQASAHAVRAKARSKLGDLDAALADYQAAIAGLNRHRDSAGGSEDLRARWAARYQSFYKEPMALRADRGEMAELQTLEAQYRAQQLRQLLGSALDPALLMPSAQAQLPPLAPDQALLSFLLLPDRVLRFHYLPGAPPQLTQLPIAEATLTADIERWRNLLAITDQSESAQAAQALGAALYQQLLSDLPDAVRQQPRWILVPDGALHALPWAALVVAADPEPTYLIEAHSLSTVPSIAVLQHLRARTPSGRTAVGVGDASGGGVATTPGTRREVRVALPQTRVEVLQLKSLYGERAHIALGAEATESWLRTEAADAALLHVAVHGVLDRDEPLRSALLLAPMGDDAADNGRLSAAEILRELKLPGTLVVLSACDSALGQPVGGDGLLGLASALQASGARAVLGTLWPVEDHATAALMQQFHAALAGSTDADLALAQAQRAWLAQTRDRSWSGTIGRWLGWSQQLPEAAEAPFYWAGFTLNGAGEALAKHESAGANARQ